MPWQGKKKYRRTKHAGTERTQRSGNETAGKRMEPDGDTHKLADGWMEQSGLYNTIASKASSLAMKAIAFVIVMLITVIAFHLIAIAIDLVAKLPVIGEVNHMLGELPD